MYLNHTIPLPGAGAACRLPQLKLKDWTYTSWQAPACDSPPNPICSFIRLYWTDSEVRSADGWRHDNERLSFSAGVETGMVAGTGALPGFLPDIAQSTKGLPQTGSEGEKGNGASHMPSQGHFQCLPHRS